MEQETEVMELSLEKVIETKLVQANVTEQVLAAMKEKYGGLRLTALDDQESYLELKAAAKEVSKVRTLTVKLCKEGRERAVKEQKLWIAKEKEIVGQVAEVEDVLDAEIAKYDNEVKRKQQEEIKRQEEAYINRQATLTRMGARYEGGSFVLGEASFEAELVKGMDEEIWNSDVVPKFQAEFEKIEFARLELEKTRRMEEERVKAEQEKLRQEQEAFRLEQEKFKQQQELEKQKRDAEAKAIYNSRVAKLQELGLVWSFTKGVFEGFGITYENDFIVNSEQSVFDGNVENAKGIILERKLQIEKAAEEKRLADIEAAKQKAILDEQERQRKLQEEAEQKKRQEELKKQQELEAANDKTKWDEVIRYLKGCPKFDMRSGQYRKKNQIYMEKLEEIINL